MYIYNAFKSDWLWTQWFKYKWYFSLPSLSQILEILIHKNTQYYPSTIIYVNQEVTSSQKQQVIFDNNNNLIIYQFIKRVFTCADQ